MFNDVIAVLMMISNILMKGEGKIVGMMMACGDPYSPHMLRIDDNRSLFLRICNPKLPQSSHL